MKIYHTTEVAAIIGIHPNTVRLYEDWELIPKPERQPNGYRIFTDLHIEQFRLARLALQVNVLQNGLRKKIIQTIKTSAAGDFDSAIVLAEEYLAKVKEEQNNAEEAIEITRSILNGQTAENVHYRKRREVSEYLNISMDTLRHWELNNLLTIKRRQNGYRVYTEEDIRQLKIIRSLRCANYSLSAILGMLSQLTRNPETDIRRALDTPIGDTDIIAAGDQLISSLRDAERNAILIITKLKEMKKQFS